MSASGSTGEDLRKKPLHERRRRLETLLSGNDVIRFSGHVEGPKGAALFQHACAIGLEEAGQRAIQVRAVHRLAQDQVSGLREAVIRFAELALMKVINPSDSDRRCSAKNCFMRTRNDRLREEASSVTI